MSLQQGKRRISIVYQLRDTEAFQSELDACTDNGCLMVVEFMQPRCVACRALAPKLDKLARERDADKGTRIFAVNALPAAGKELARSQAVSALPTVAVFHAGEKVLQRTVAVKEWQDFVDTLEEFEQRLEGRQPDENSSGEQLDSALEQLRGVVVQVPRKELQALATVLAI